MKCNSDQSLRRHLENTFGLTPGCLDSQQSVYTSHVEYVQGCGKALLSHRIRMAQLFEEMINYIHLICKHTPALSHIWEERDPVYDGGFGSRTLISSAVRGIIATRYINVRSR